MVGAPWPPVWEREVRAVFFAIILSDCGGERQLKKCMTNLPLPQGSPDDFRAPGDKELLRQFVHEAREAAFAELVRRHSGLVFATALRRSGSPEVAQEAVQNVFTALARKASRLGSSVSLMPWLHRAAVLESAALIRREARYRQAMKRRQDDPTSLSSELPASADGDLWDSVKPLVDDALNALSSRDREVLLLHHGEGRTFREIATRLGLTAEAAQRSGHRALEKLANRLRKRGVPVPALTLGTALTAGLMSDASAAATACSAGMLPGKALSLAAHAGPALPVPAWMASPVMLVTFGLTAGSLPIWWAGYNQPPPPPATALSSNSAIDDASQSRTKSPSIQQTPIHQNFLAEALAALKETPADSGPTKLGLQIRKYMLALPAEDLRAASMLLKGYPINHREMVMVVAAFSARLAELDPSLALELVQSGNGKNADPDFSKSIDKAALLDVLTRNSLSSLMDAGKSHPALMIATLESLATHDGASAMKYTADSLAPEFQPESYRRCFYSWATCQPGEALQWLDGQFMAEPDQSGRLREEWMLNQSISLMVRQSSPQEIIRLMPLLNDDQLRNDVLKTFFYSYGDEHPEVMVRLVPWLRMEDGAQPVSVASLVYSWLKKDPAGVAAWAASLPAGELKTAAERTLAKPNPYEK